MEERQRGNGKLGAAVLKRRGEHKEEVVVQMRAVGDLFFGAEFYFAGMVAQSGKGRGQVSVAVRLAACGTGQHGFCIPSVL